MNVIELVVIISVVVLVAVGTGALRYRSGVAKNVTATPKGLSDAHSPSGSTHGSSTYKTTLLKRNRAAKTPIKTTPTASVTEVLRDDLASTQARPDRKLDEQVLVDLSDQSGQNVEDDVLAIVSEPRPSFGLRLGGIFRKKLIDETFWQDLEDALILSDVGVETSAEIIGDARAKVLRLKFTTPEQALSVIRDAMVGSLSSSDRSLKLDGGAPVVILFVGVNGVGKTTTIGKVAKMLSNDHSVLFAAADTFRAAASDQLALWAERVSAPIVIGAPGGDPSAVLFDAITSARAKGIEIVLGDTAGRLQNKTNLIEELKKVYRTIEKAQGAVGEVLLVLDATTGQNGLSQAKVFGEAVGVTGVVLTKLDGSAKGGIAFAIEKSFGIPVKLVGVGESLDDLVPFDPRSYVESLIEI